VPTPWMRRGRPRTCPSPRPALPIDRPRPPPSLGPREPPGRASDDCGRSARRRWRTRRGRPRATEQARAAEAAARVAARDHRCDCKSLPVPAKTRPGSAQTGVGGESEGNAAARGQTVAAWATTRATLRHPPRHLLDPSLKLYRNSRPFFPHHCLLAGARGAARREEARGRVPVPVWALVLPVWD